MRSVVAGAILLVLTGPALSQLTMSGGRPALGFPLGGGKPNDPDPQREQRDEEYKSAVDKIPPKQQQKGSDPWSGVRSTTTDPKSSR
jgi:hypothetical protein